MALTNKIPQKAKSAATAAATTFVAANPLFSLFLAGVGIAIYFTYRSRRGY